MFHPQGPTFAELMIQALSSTDGGYDLLARKFDYTPFRTPEPILGALLPHVQTATPVERALDLCCGTGAGIPLLLQLAQHVIGIDRSAGMLGVARSHFAGDARVRWVRGDALQMPFSNVFDVVTCHGAFGHILPADEPILVENVHRALRPNGRFVFVTSELPPL